jgi:flavin reductase (DIM6/NTAB) family NADH-FMN oxidoreductase RutF
VSGGQAVDEGRFKDVMARFATGVTIVTALDGGAPVGFTCQSFVSLSIDPPFVSLAPAKTSTSWPRIARAGAFCVNVLAEGQEDLCRRFATSGADKFTGVPWTPAPESGSPVLPGSLAWVDCALELVHDAGDHEIVVGRVLGLGTGGGRPLLFYDRGFARLAPGQDR